ncbi:MAG: hypothetical protein HWE34_04360 [Methylocystaceae bacterium]|nr:hypothetical protein [Methylocystaceae bacterium]
MSNLFAERLRQHLRLAVLLYLQNRPETDERRLAILRILSQAPAYTANASIIQDFLVDMGMNPSRDMVRTDLAWLDEQKLVSLNIDQGVYGAVASSRGIEAAEGKISIPGISKPADLNAIKESLLKISLSPSDLDLLNELMWLTDKALLTQCVFGHALSITNTGRDVAQGKVQIEGIKKPSADTLMRTAAQSIKGSFGER